MNFNTEDAEIYEEKKANTRRSIKKLPRRQGWIFDRINRIYRIYRIRKKFDKAASVGF